MERRRIVFSGRVQGVGFRVTARQIASGHGVTGWVRNVEDGTVEMEIQGNPGEIDRCLHELRGEMGRFIQGETAEHRTLSEEELGFEIRR